MCGLNKLIIIYFVEGHSFRKKLLSNCNYDTNKIIFLMDMSVTTI